MSIFGGESLDYNMKNFLGEYQNVEKRYEMIAYLERQKKERTLKMLLFQWCK